MEPILPEPTAPNAVPQNQEFTSSDGAHLPASAESAPNTAPEQSRETLPQSVPVAVPTPVQQITPSGAVPVAGTAQGVAAQTDDPLIADDVDVIEKEWVDKAKKIVNATKENPYEQEKEVSKLQADYLMKRYNKQIKLSE